MTDRLVDENGFFLPEPGKPGFPVSAEFDRKNALLTLEEFEALPVCTEELPDVIPTFTWKAQVKNDKGQVRWIIGRYEPIKNDQGVVKKCRVILRELLIENGSSRQDDEGDRQRYEAYWP